MEASSGNEGAEHKIKFLNSLENWTRDALDVSGEKIKDLFNHHCSCSNNGERGVEMDDALIQKMRSAISSYACKSIKDDTVEVLDEQGCDQKFQLLLSLKAKYKGNQTAWRPPYDAKEHMRAMRMAAKREKLEKLEILISIKKHAVSRVKQELNARMVNSNQETVTLDQLDLKCHKILSSCEQVSSHCKERNAAMAAALCKRDFTQL